MVNRSGGDFSRLATLLVGILGVIALASGLVFGQGFSAAISGVVRDPTAAVLPGVTVTAKHLESGQTRTVNTNESGDYRMPALPVGAYEVTAELTGFKQQVRSGITLVVAQEAVVNLTLAVGDIKDQVTVTEEAPLVNTTLSSTSGLINEGQIKDMPLNGRSFEQLLTLNTGTVNNNVHSGGSSFSVGGKRTETNRFTMNGVDYVGDNATGQYIAPQGASQQLLGVDAVREYNVLGYTYGSEYGKTGRRLDYRGDYIGHEPVAWSRLRVPPHQRIGRPELLRPYRPRWRRNTRCRDVQTEPVWRIAGRPHHQKQDVCVRKL